MGQTQTLKWPRVHQSRYGKVTIYKQSRIDGDMYTLAWYVGKKRVRETSIDQTQAQARASEILSMYRDGNPPREPRKREPKSKKSWGHVIGDVPMEEVVKHYAQTHNLLPSITIENVCKGYMSVKVNSGISARYRQTLQHHLNRFSGQFGAQNISSVSVEDINNYLLAFADLRTRFNHRASLQGLFKWAKSQNYVHKSNVEDTELPKFKAKTPALFSSDELKKLAEVASERNMPMLIAAAYAGIRMSEIERLRWSDINWDERAFVLGPEITKTNRGRVAYFPQCVEEKLRNLAVVARLKDCTKFLQDTCSDHISELVRKSGVSWKKNGLRKTFISCRIAQTRNAAEVAEQCGNSSTVIQQNYKGLVTKSEAETWFNILA
jgi:integrase